MFSIQETDLQQKKKENTIVLYRMVIKIKLGTKIQHPHSLILLMRRDDRSDRSQN